MRATRRYGLHPAAIVCCALAPLAPLAACGSGTVQARAATDPAGFSAADLASAASALPSNQPSNQLADQPSAQPGTEPVKPSQQRSAASAESSLGYFWDAYNYAYQTFDTRPLDSVSQQACTVCTEVRNDVLSIQASGVHVEGYRVQVSKPAASAAVAGTTAKVVATIHRDDGRALDPKGGSTDLPGFEARRCIATLTWNGTAWVITKIVTEDL